MTTATARATFRKHPVLTALLALFGLYAAVVLALFAAQRAILFPAPKGPSQIPSGFEKAELHTRDGLTLTAAWRPGAPGKHTVLFFHGNGDSLPGAALATQGLSKAGYGLLLADYRGYAGNPGNPTEAGLIADGHAALAFLTRRGIAPRSIVLMGASLGTGIATRLASETPPRALVLISPFTSLRDAAADALPWVPARRLIRDSFESAALMPEVKAPVLVLHARDDRVIPFEQGEALERAAHDGHLIPFSAYGHQLQFTAPAQDAVLIWLTARRL